MNKSIYDEALEIIDINTSYADKISILGVNDRTKIEQALEQAQKQDKLLKLYQKLYKIPRIISTLDEQLEIEKLIKELEDDK